MRLFSAFQVGHILVRIGTSQKAKKVCDREIRLENHRSLSKEAKYSTEHPREIGKCSPLHRSSEITEVLNSVGELEL